MSQYTPTPHALLREYATKYVRDYGFVLIPLKEGRGSAKPAIYWTIDGEHKDDLVDTVEKIDRWWPDATKVNRRTPRHGIAIACGPSGIVAIDFDSDHVEYGQRGGHMDMTGPAQLDLLPDTFRQKTRSGGTHMLYRHDHTVESIICKTHEKNRIAPRVDVKGHRGLLVMAPTQIYTTNKTPTNEDATPLVDVPKTKTNVRALLPGQIEIGRAHV